MERVRVGIVGSGAMGVRHARAWSALGAEVLLYSPTPAHRFAAARDCGVGVADSLDGLLGAVELVDVCTPTDTHRDVALRAAAAGRGVICEKPLARTVSEGEAMIAACAAAGVALLPAQVLRFYPAYADARRSVAAGQIGAPSALELRRAVDWPDYAPWLADSERSGGVLLDLMIHDFDYARWVAGEVVQVEASCTAVTGVARLTHAGGAVSQVHGAWGEPFRSVLEITGTGGAVRWDSDRDPSGLPADDEDAPYRYQLAEFRDAILAGMPARIDAADGLAALRIALAAEESSLSGRPVQLNPGRGSGQ